MCIGKWHVGDQPEFLPTRQGFDHYFGIPYSNDMQRKSTETGEKVVPLVRDDKVAELLTDEEQSRDRRALHGRGGRIHPREARTSRSSSTCRTPRCTRRSIRARRSRASRPTAASATGWRKWTGASGRVLDTLRELKLDERTLVIFTSDNGPWLIKGADGGSALPLRGGKGSTWEGGVRVPTLAWWPGKIAPGSVCDAVAGTIDLLPTAVAHRRRARCPPSR